MSEGPSNLPPGVSGDLPTDALTTALYDQLRAVASASLRNERHGHTLQPTALVHEAYLRLAELDSITWRDPGHFAVAAAGAIRRVLVDHARARSAVKRGGGWIRLSLAGSDLSVDAPDIDLLALEEQLESLARRDPRKARVVELRFFGGLTIEDTAKALGVGTTTVEDDWTFARAWLRQRLAEGRP